MRALIQRVDWAKVTVDGSVVGQIDTGLCAFIGVEPTDSTQVAERLLKRLLGYRIFSDDNYRMNLSLTDVGGGLLLVPQFTLCADTRKGMRPSFSGGANPELGKQLFEELLEQAKRQHPAVVSGIFGADMRVSLCNNGPVTFNLQT